MGIARRVGVCAGMAVVCCAGAAPSSFNLVPVGWRGFAQNSHHWALPKARAQAFNRIKWSTAVDASPSGGAHYGSPMITPSNTLVVTVRNGSGAFHLEGRRVSDGAVQWTQNTSYNPPTSGWLPECGSTLTVAGGVAIPDSGGRVLVRASADAASSTTQELVFFGAANYAANPSGFNNTVKINTPITTDSAGNLFFGFAVSGTPPITLHSGIARIAPDGTGTWVQASVAANDTSITRCQHNCAPGLSLDESRVYIGVRDSGSHGYLLCLNARTLATLGRQRCHDPNINGDAELTDFSTASPMIAPDDSVYFGVLDPGNNNNDRGWLLHFDAMLTQQYTPGAFGWDNTPSPVMAASVGSYHGSSPYLLMCKYNNYAGAGTGNGINKIAIIDPFATQTDPITGVTIMQEVITKVGPTPDPSNPGGVREWCINTAAVDAYSHAVMANNEDGKLYRWNLDTNTLEQVITLTSGASEAYTPTIIGPDGTVYAINAATLFAVGQ